MQIICETPDGGCVELNEEHGVRASYAVATVGDRPPAELLHVWTKLRDGRTVSYFLNRETGLAVVDVFDTSEKSGVEILRRRL
jgi:hypothetical protein